MESKGNGHGGKRQGAGRKGRFGNCQFKTMRIPDFLCPHVGVMLDMAAEWNNHCLPMSDRRSLPASQVSEKQRALTVRYLKKMIEFEEERMRQRSMDEQDRRQLDLFKAPSCPDSGIVPADRPKRPRDYVLDDGMDGTDTVAEDGFSYSSDLFALERDASFSVPDVAVLPPAGGSGSDVSSSVFPGVVSSGTDSGSAPSVVSSLSVPSSDDSSLVSSVVDLPAPVASAVSTAIPHSPEERTAVPEQFHFINANENLVEYGRCIDELGCIYWRRSTQKMKEGETVYLFLMQPKRGPSLYRMQVDSMNGPREDARFHKRFFRSDEPVFRFVLKERYQGKGLDYDTLKLHGISRHTLYKILDRRQVAWLRSLFLSREG